MAAVLAWQAPVANAARMPPGWTDAAGAALLGMVDRLGASLPTVLNAAATRAVGALDEATMGWAPGTAANLTMNPVLRLQALYSIWGATLDAGGAPPELETPSDEALAALRASATLNLVYLRALAISELPAGTVPTFSSIMIAARPSWRALSGRDVRINGPEAPATTASLGLGLGLGLLAWYLWLRRRFP